MHGFLTFVGGGNIKDEATGVFLGDTKVAFFRLDDWIDNHPGVVVIFNKVCLCAHFGSHLDTYWGVIFHHLFIRAFCICYSIKYIQDIPEYLSKEGLKSRQDGFDNDGGSIWISCVESSMEILSPLV